MLLDEPPRVKIRWEENAAPGTKEGAIINIGAGFTIAKEMLHKDLYFPSFDAIRPNLDMFNIPQGHSAHLWLIQAWHWVLCHEQPSNGGLSNGLCASIAPGSKQI